jgi:hypothetical protein
MPVFTNPIRGFLGKVGAEMTAQAHFRRFAPRELRVNSYQLFKDMGVEEKVFADFEKSIKLGLVKEIGEDEEKILRVAKHVCDEIRHSIRDIMMIGIFQVNMLKKIFLDDEGIIKKGFPSQVGKKLESEVKAELEDTLHIIHESGNTLINM